MDAQPQHDLGGLLAGLGCACASSPSLEPLPTSDTHDPLAAILAAFGDRSELPLGPVGAGVLPSATAVTVSAATALDAHLASMGAVGCDDLKSTLRQLTFTFKAAFLTDPATQNTPEAAALNMSTPLAMTGFGPGTNAALSYVLRADRTYMGSAVTDSQGNCLLNLPTPQIPADLAPLAQQLAQQVLGAIKTATAQNQGSVLSQLKIIVGNILGQLAVANVQGGGGIVPTPTPAPPVPAPETKPTPAPAAAKPFPTATVVVGGLVGVVVLGGIVLAVRHQQMKRRRAA